MGLNKPKQYSDINSLDKAKLFLAALDDKQGSRLMALDVSGLTQVTDMIILATARTMRHAQALADHMLDVAGRENIEYLGMEGYKSGEWILVDMNDVVIHLFQADARDFYNLEGLWSDGEPVEFTPAPAPADDDDDWPDDEGEGE